MIPEKSLLLLSLLALLVLGLSQRSLAESQEEKFRRQHVDSGNKGNPGKKYCDQMMAKRGMTKGKCKPVNTFVHESYQKIQDICHEASTPCANPNMHNCHKSAHPLRITQCRLKGGSKPGKCRYLVKNANKHVTVTVACGGKPLKPIHLDPPK
ncbi:ribonuclease pancreatic delta-type-like [Vombatus ursinus]|uniref:Ribonuclease A-domain domain-containing protein n=1 Tax=Vombatus ursinus TaxID=29139 RepID=A0A4X2LYJ2_VOMUR|nr:ribonuclease pancreatic delta-type-like [Vombatus ursinus]XP_027698992.1 ribonuclease pancreatic delta-type-like [Vombatus ursinus]